MKLARLDSAPVPIVRTPRFFNRQRVNSSNSKDLGILRRLVNVMFPVPKDIQYDPFEDRRFKDLSMASTATRTSMASSISSVDEGLQRMESTLSPLPGVQLAVTGFSVGTDSIVMYHIDVVDGCSTYTIRRRYRDFEQLHAQLAKMMILESSLTKKQLAMFNLFPNPYPVLPALPARGIYSYLKKYDQALLQQRKDIFQRMLKAATQHPVVLATSILQEFISVAPSTLLNRGSSYVSLQDYSVSQHRHSHEQYNDYQAIKARNANRRHSISKF